MEKRSESSNWVPGIALFLAVVLGCAWLPGGQAAWAGTDLQWTWMKGANTVDQPGVYGTLGTAAAINTPSARYHAVSWTDVSGNFWLFGGYRFFGPEGFGYLDDMWKYTPSTGNWTWMKGVSTKNPLATYGTMGTPAAANTPGGRIGAVSWTDTSGALWLFGGYGRESTGGERYNNDLWKYTPSTGNWTWMKGSSTTNLSGTYGTRGTAAVANNPGAREDAVSWTDASGALWLFGGYGVAGVENSWGVLNDLWKYTPATGNWTWMRGANTVEAYGTYGTRGTAAAANTPGSRNFAVSWTDSTGALWLFGGNGRAAVGLGDLNDLWKYTPATGNWTWMKGSDSAYQADNHGTLGTPAAENTPGGRYGAKAGIDASGALWLFGGQGIRAMSDLWKYDRTTGNWTWMKGSSDGFEVPVYGTLGTPAAANTPAHRIRDASSFDTSGALWLFGGNSVHSNGSLNDLWRIELSDTTPPTGRVVINGNRSATNSRNVSIGLTWSDGVVGLGVARMRFSDDGSTWSAYESLTPSKSYTLPVGNDGHRTVRVQFIDLANNRSATYSDYIRLDRSAPTGGILINNGASTTASRSVTLKLNWADTGAGVTRMRFSDNGSTWTTWLYPAATKAYTLPAGLGYHTVRVQYLDGANNYSPVYNDYIKLVSP
jgi:N-acetylneuraminic acid mutarotase